LALVLGHHLPESRNRKEGMRLYHFTSYENWLNIKKEGLTPYQIKDSDVRKKLGYVDGIWSWKTKPEGMAKIGHILLQAGNKKSTKVVELSYGMNEEGLFKDKKGKVGKVEMNGWINQYKYCDGDEAVFVKRQINPEEITHIRTYDLLEMFK